MDYKEAPEVCVMYQINRLIKYIDRLCTPILDANWFLPYCVFVCSLTPRVGTAGIMKIWTFKIYFFLGKIAYNSYKTKTCSFKHIIVFTVLIEILIIGTDKTVFFKSMLRHLKRVTHWKPTQNFKFKLVNIFKSYSQHNHQVYFRNKFCFISSKLYLIFTTQWLICTVPITVRFTEPYWFSYSINP